MEIGELGERSCTQRSGTSVLNNNCTDGNEDHTGVMLLRFLHLDAPWVGGEGSSMGIESDRITRNKAAEGRGTDYLMVRFRMIVRLAAHTQPTHMRFNRPMGRSTKARRTERLGLNGRRSDTTAGSKQVLAVQEAIEATTRPCADAATRRSCSAPRIPRSLTTCLAHVSMHIVPGPECFRGSGRENGER